MILASVDTDSFRSLTPAPEKGTHETGFRVPHRVVQAEAGQRGDHSRLLFAIHERTVANDVEPVYRSHLEEIRLQGVIVGAGLRRRERRLEERQDSNPGTATVASFLVRPDRAPAQSRGLLTRWPPP
jgi:hypothetical protein